MNHQLENKVALVTGASRGIGRSIALELATQGADVVVNYNKNREMAEAVVQKIASMGRKALAQSANVTNKLGVENMVQETISKLGLIDILVNNAGIIHFSDLLGDEALFQEMFNVNVMGILYCTKAVAEQMKSKKSGKVINISSVAGIGISETGSGGYAVTKAAVIMLTKRLGVELGPFGINVNCVAPGYIKTDMAGAGKTPEEEEQQEKRVAGITMMRRVAKPEEVAKVVAFLASSDSNFISGQTITVDGGRMNFLSHSM
ncbi:MAG: 3-oxoacyl-ACP reductase FabG [Thaumarchaeota archaeon]|nr:3-oxoacyl-ACP reductase FabG [Nitrososphaerota archaeon]